MESPSLPSNLAVFTTVLEQTFKEQTYKERTSASLFRNSFSEPSPLERAG
jgi:hypothetical protein